MYKIICDTVVFTFVRIVFLHTYLGLELSHMRQHRRKIPPFCPCSLLQFSAFLMVFPLVSFLLSASGCPYDLADFYIGGSGLCDKNLLSDSEGLVL